MDESGIVGQPLFPTTHWSEVRLSGGTGDASLAAFDNLISKYRRPLLIHLQSKFVVSEDRANDWLQEFMYRKVLHDRVFALARGCRGRFRTFLLNCLDHFIVSSMRKESAKKRAPDGGMVSFEVLPGEPAGMTHDPLDTFTLAWAQEVLFQTLTRMRAECAAKNHERRWRLFEMMVVEPLLGGSSRPPYSTIVGPLGFRSPAEAHNSVETAKRQFDRIFRQVIAEYAGPGGEVEEEIRDLRRVLASTSH